MGGLPFAVFAKSGPFYGVHLVKNCGPLFGARALQAAGQRYIGSGPFISMIEIAYVLKERLCDKAKEVPTRKLPDWLVRIVGLFDSEVRGQLLRLNDEESRAAHRSGYSFEVRCRMRA